MRFRTSTGFVVTGERSDPALPHPVATLWFSPDGRNWRRNDDASFLRVRDGKTKVSGGADSRIYDITEWRGEYLAIGEVFTKSGAPAGLMSCVWTSADGITWQRRFADLGDGFDPYFWSVATHGDKVVAGGRVGKWPATSWVSSDLRRWTESTIAESAGATVSALPRGYLAAGGITSGRRRENKGKATLWWSPNGADWQPTLSLASRTDGYFATVGIGNGLVVVTGPRETASVHVSSDGRSWFRTSPPADAAPNLEFRVVGDADGLVYVMQANRMWQVARNS